MRVRWLYLRVCTMYNVHVSKRCCHTFGHIYFFSYILSFIDIMPSTDISFIFFFHFFFLLKTILYFQLYFMRKIENRITMTHCYLWPRVIYNFIWKCFSLVIIILLFIFLIFTKRTNLLPLRVLRVVKWAFSIGSFEIWIHEWTSRNEALLLLLLV